MAGRGVLHGQDGGARRWPASGRRGAPPSRRSPWRTRAAASRPRRSRAARPARLRALDRRRLRRAGGRHLRGVRGRCRATSRSPARSRWAGRRRARSRPGARWRCRPGGVIPDGRRRGRHGRVHPGGDAGHDRGRPAGGAGRRLRARRRGRRAAAPSSRPPAAPLRAQDLGLLAAAGVTEVGGARPPARGDRLDRRRGRAAATADAAAPARSATPARSALAALVREAGGEPDPARDRPRRRTTRSQRVLREAARRRATSWSCRRARRSAPATRPPPSSPGWAKPGSAATGSPSARQADAAGRLRRRAADRAAGQPALGAGRLPAASGCRSCARVAGITRPPRGARRPRARAGARRRRRPPGGSTSCRSADPADGIADAAASGSRRCCRC